MGQYPTVPINLRPSHGFLAGYLPDDPRIAILIAPNEVSSSYGNRHVSKSEFYEVLAGLVSMGKNRIIINTSLVKDPDKRVWYAYERPCDDQVPGIEKIPVIIRERDLPDNYKPQVKAKTREEIIWEEICRCQGMPAPPVQQDVPPFIPGRVENLDEAIRIAKSR